jgi:hemolysin activation/secretion protein
VSQESSFGIKGLGATSENNPVASRPGSRPDFFKTEFQLTRLQRLPWGTQGSVSLETQLASSKLFPQEELYVGGADSVRGYPEGDYLADAGLIARFEYLIPCAFLPAQWRLPGAKGSLGEQVQLVAFLDRGYGRLRAITGDERVSRNLMGLGGGVRFRFNDTLSARLEWGHAVGDRPLTDDSSSVLHFRIQSTL